MSKKNTSKDVVVKRGDIFLADLDPARGSEQRGTRPVLVIQNNVGNKFSPTIIIAPITGYLQKTNLPTHVMLRGEFSGLERDSIVLLEQIRTIDKVRLITKLGEVSKVTLLEIEQAMLVSLGLDKKDQI